MTFRLRLAALLAVVALAAAACGASTPIAGRDLDSESGNDEAILDSEAIDVFSLGDLEAGFGPGSSVAIAGQILSRLAEIEGDWRQMQPYTYKARPLVCGVPEPVAIQGGSTSLFDPNEFALFDFIGAEVLIFESEMQALEVVEATNGPNSEECDRAQLEQSDLAGRAADVGLNFDMGDGVGHATDNPSNLPSGFVAETRRHVGTLGAGSIIRDVVQVESTVAAGSIVVRFVAITASDQRDDGGIGDGGSEQLLEVASDLLLSEPLPDIVVDAQLDSGVDVVRRSLLNSDDIPEFWEASLPVSIFREQQDASSCYQASIGQARVAGSSWISVSPGAGVSQLSQNTSIYVDDAAALASFTELVDLGVDCFVDSLELTPEFRVNGRAFDAVEIDGKDVVVVRLDVAQTVGTQVIDVEFGFAAARTGRFATSVFFGGLIGDSPDLGQLVSTAAKRLEEQNMETE